MKGKKEEDIDFVKWFSELNKDSGPIAGGKGANLAEIFNLKTPVPPGFVITAQAYDYFIKQNNLNKKIEDLLEKISYEETKQLNETTQEIRDLIIKSKIPKEMESEILESYENLGIKKENILGGDINADAVEHCKGLGFECVKSDLFENVEGKFDVIIFNPPYLPEDEREPEDSKTATTGGREGGEIINRFLEEARNYLKKDGRIYLITSSLTYGVDWKGWKKKKVGEKKMFMEELVVWGLQC